MIAFFSDRNYAVSIVKACELACIDKFIEQQPKKYETYIERVGTNVSGCQKQALCIESAIL